MRKVMLAVFAVCVSAMAAAAQDKANYSGTWTLDKEKSTFSGPMRVDSMTLTVAQTAKDIKVDTSTKRLPPNDGPAGGGPGRGMGGRGFGMGDGSTTYSLDGKEIKTEMDGPNGKMPVTHKGKLDADGSLKLTTTRSFTGPMGEMTMTTNETWKLSADGKTLTIDRENTTPRGAQTSKLVFTKG
ncbi:MAG TPA: hypothetical protein VFZ49_05840 [Pyrinomonadaceae bacterium]